VPVLVVAATTDERQRLVDWLAPYYRVVAPLPQPAAAAAAASPEGMADWLVGVMEGLGLDGRPVVLGPAFAALAGAMADRLEAADALVVAGPDADRDALLAALAGTRAQQED
jgi:hypothetical protein